MNLFKRKKYISAAVNGEVVPLSNVSDEVFSSGVLGEGFAIIPRGRIIYSPINAKIESIHESKHAFTLVGEGGEELLIHIGINTTELKGECFDTSVSEGKYVKKGEIIATVDTEKIIEKGYDPITMVILTNTDKFKIKSTSYGEVVAGEEVVEIERA